MKCLKKKERKKVSEEGREREGQNGCAWHAACTVQVQLAMLVISVPIQSPKSSTLRLG
jgi:hypothetical protein